MTIEEILEALAHGKTLTHPELNESFSLSQGSGQITWHRSGISMTNLTLFFLHILAFHDDYMVVER